MAVVRSSDAAAGTVMVPPLKDSALPKRPPVVQATLPFSVPRLLLPELSATKVPAPSSKEYAATRPAGGIGTDGAGGAGMVGVWVLSKVAVRVAVPALPAASRAVTVSTFEPAWRTIPLAVQLVAPVAVPDPPRLFV